MADERMGLGPQFAVARVEQGHEVAGSEDRIDAKLRASGMRRLAFGADERPQTSFVSRKDGIVGGLADNDKSSFGCCFTSAREPLPSISSSATNIRTSVPRQRSRCAARDGRPRPWP